MNTDTILASLKAYAALVGAVATALVGVFGADTLPGKIVTGVLAVATAIAVYQVPNLDSRGKHKSESVQRSDPV